jgi:hypothetical protein
MNAPVVTYRHHVRYHLWRLRYWLIGDARKLWVAQHVPRWLVYWCAIRLMAHATSGKHDRQGVNALTAMEALDRWEDR